ncbi:MAG: hypothetical protein U5R14_14210 [Gemmatimonadota bacterium]|nr:hypothetical protein [Gemmatimonadota bacterium]
MSPARGSAARRERQAVGLAIGWTLLLVALAAVWIRSPVLGTGAAFVIWSAPAGAFGFVSWRWLRARRIEEIPTSRATLAAVAACWIGGLALATTHVGPTLALDGLIMRRPLLASSGRALTWLPLVIGLGLAVAGLSASLEARYRLRSRSPMRATTPGRAR